MSTVFKNFKIIKNGTVLPASDLLVEGDRIVSIGNNLSGDKTVDGKGEYWLSAGFIDIHTHGGGGYDFMDGVAEEYVGVAKKHAKFGATSLYPTTVSATTKELENTIDAFKKAKEINTDGANLLGIHLEGPYLSPDMCGAMDPKYLRTPDDHEYENIFSKSEDIVRMTFAPELKGAVEIANYLKDHNLIGSLGHTNSTSDQVEGVHKEYGFNLMTHMYSCMSMTMRRNAWRYAGAVEAAYLLDDMYVEVIADGCHLPKDLLSLIYKVKGEERIVLVTDSMRAAGLDDGIYTFGSHANGYDVVVEDGVAKLMDRSAFAGSVATPDRLVRTMVKLVGIDIPKAVRMITENPAKVMRIDNERGFLDDGKAADLVAFDDNINIQMTMVGGKIVYTA